MVKTKNKGELCYKTIDKVLHIWNETQLWNYFVIEQWKYNFVLKCCGQFELFSMSCNVTFADPVLCLL